MFMFMPIFVQSGNGQCLPRKIQRCCLYIGNLKVSNSLLLQSGLGLGLGLGYVWGCVLGKEALYGYIWILYGKWHQSGLCFGLWFGERSTIWILYGQSWQNWAFKQAVAWNKLVSQIITSFVSLWRYGPGVLKGPPHLCRTCNYSQLLDVA